MKTANSTVLITGANRGIGRALIDESLRRGAKRVYAGTRQPMTHPDARVVPLVLDVTSAEQIKKAVGSMESLDILINNAGLALPDDLTDRVALEKQLAVNLFGTYSVSGAFLPMLTRSRGAIVNVLSVSALASLPMLSSYSISKAAAFSLTQAQRALWAGRGISVHAVLAGPVDTDMARGIEVAKATPESVARAILDGMENGVEDIFPDPMSETLAEGWNSGVSRSLQRQFAAFMPESAKSAA